jgi:heptosyltransferase-2
MQRILIIQTAFIGDAVLATGLVEKLHQHYPHASIDILVRKGNEGMFQQHPFLQKVLIWQKQEHKYRHLWQLLLQIRSRKYDLVVNVQRFAATGLLTAFSGAKMTVGFDKNPFSFLFTKKIAHRISTAEAPLHEYQRNHELITFCTDDIPAKPKLYPTTADKAQVAPYAQGRYVCIAPASVWFTKQFPKVKWIELIQALPADIQIFLIGAPGDKNMCDEIIAACPEKSITNLCGKLGFLASAALMQHAVMNYVNDSAPMHFASSVDAPVTAVYCSTIPAFGFGPLSSKNYVVEVPTALDCRPCGLHGQKACPKGHFNCAMQIQTSQLLAVLS